MKKQNSKDSFCSLIKKKKIIISTSFVGTKLKKNPSIFHRSLLLRAERLERERKKKRTKGRQRQSEFRVEIHAIPAIKRSNEVARRYQKTETRFLRERGVQTERSAGNTVPRHAFGMHATPRKRKNGKGTRCATSEQGGHSHRAGRN